MEVLGYRKIGLPPERQESLVRQYVACAEMVVLEEPWPPLPIFCRDPKDRMFLALALQENIPLISGDMDLTSLAAVATVPIMTLAELHAWKGPQTNPS